MSWADKQTHETLVLVRAFEEEELAEYQRAVDRAKRQSAKQPRR